MSGLRRLPKSQSQKSLLAAIDSPEQLQSIFADLSNARPGRGGEGYDGGAGDDEDQVGHLRSVVDSLETKLQVSAQLGLALLERKEQLAEANRALEAKNRELEAGLNQLLDRLATAYRENAQVIKRAERAQANLDASEASNRQLLITLEEDRKAIRRLSASNARHGDKKAMFHQMEDLQYELETERRRSTAAEARERKAAMRLSHLDETQARLEKGDATRLPSSVINYGRTRQRPASVNLGRISTFSDNLYDSSRLGTSPRSSSSAVSQWQDLLKREPNLLNNDQPPDAHVRNMSAVEEEADDGSHESTASQVGPSNGSTDMEHTASRRTSATSEWQGPSSVRVGSITKLPPGISAADGSHLPESGQFNQRRRSIRMGNELPVRRVGDRAMSVDFSSWSHRRDNENAGFAFGWQRPLSPTTDGRSTSPNALRPLALGSSCSSVSPSLRGSPLLPPAAQMPEDDDNDVSEGPTILEIGPSPIKLPSHEPNAGYAGESPIKLRQSHRQLLRSSQSRDVAVQTDEDVEKQTSTAGEILAKDFYQSSVVSSDIPSDHHFGGSLSASNSLAQELAAHAQQSKSPSLTRLMEHVTKLVSKLQTADLHSLELRLKRHNLPGDVNHLARTTMRDLLNEVEQLREHSRQMLQQNNTAKPAASHGSSDQTVESLVSRRDFFALVKVFRDTLSELGKLRTILNRVQLEPALLPKIKEMESLPTLTELINYVPATAFDKSAAATLLAPLSRLFYGSETAASPGPSAPAQRPPMPQSRSTSARLAPKIGASSALAPANVNVQFGGPGGMRRQVSMMPGASSGGLSDRYKRDAARDLGSIFAGGASYRTNSAEPWTVVGRDRYKPSAAPNTRQTMSQNVDAVIDGNIHNDGEDFHPNLLERTLRPRGLSDSSIHSTFMAHANPGTRLLTPAALALSAASPTTLENDRTLRAKSSTTPRPSLLGAAGNQLRKISGGLPSPGIMPAHGVPSQSLPTPPMVSVDDVPAAAASMPLPIPSSGETHDAIPTQVSRSAAKGGFVASLGAWATKAGGIASSYSDSSETWQKQHRSVVPTAKRKTTREPEV